MADRESDDASTHNSLCGSTLDLSVLEARDGSVAAHQTASSPRAEASLAQVEVSRESAERMMANVAEKSARIGAAYAKMLGDLQDRSQRQVTNQVEYLDVHHQAVTEATSEIHEAVRSMNELVCIG